jgi:transcriptional/translational regulatory protein YebC/TACO1
LEAKPDDIKSLADNQVELTAAAEKFDAIEKALKSADLTIRAFQIEMR